MYKRRFHIFQKKTEMAGSSIQITHFLASFKDSANPQAFSVGIYKCTKEYKQSSV